MANTSTTLSQQQTTSIKQIQRLMMLPQMQQAMHLLQMPVLELSNLIQELQIQNPVLCESDDEEDNKEEDEDLIRLEEEEEEQPEEENSNDDKSLSFKDEDFAILQKLDDDFRCTEGDIPFRKNEDVEQMRNYAEQSIRSTSSLFEHLMQQAEETFETKEELSMAEQIIGNLSSEGYLATPLEEISLQNNFSLEQLQKVLKGIQTFTPYGVGASSLQEALLIQLRCQGKQDTLAVDIIEKHFDDLLHNHIPAIEKGLGCSAKSISEAIANQIAHLDLHPGTTYSRDSVQQIVPDVSLLADGEKLRVVINDDFIPSLRLNSRYMRMMEDPSIPLETKEFIKKKIVSAKWLVRNIYERNETLEKVVNTLAKRQAEFFLNPLGKLEPLTMKMVAEELNLHESTIARAVANKYLDCPRGIIALRSFFTNAYANSHGEDISSRTVRDVLEELINNEDKHHPLSDADLSDKLKEKGIDCARRTIAKYRLELKLGNARQRRKF